MTRYRDDGPSGTSLQGGSGWSISGALYVTNLRTRRSLMPVRGPWCGHVCAWVIKYDEKGGGVPFWGREREIVVLLDSSNVRRCCSANAIARDCRCGRDYIFVITGIE